MEETFRDRRRERDAAAEHRVLRAAAEGDRGARAAAVERYRGLVVKVARGLHGRGGSEELEDLIQVGMIGLLEAIDRFDPERGAFSCYAAATVSGTIKRHFRDRSWRLRIPRGLHDAATLIRSRRPELEARLGRPASEAELAMATGLTLERVREAEQLLASAQPASLEAQVGEQALELAELVGADDPNLGRAEARGLIAGLSAELGGEDRELLARRFGLGQTQVEIAARIGGSQMRVSRRLQKLLAQMARSAGDGAGDGG